MFSIESGMKIYRGIDHAAEFFRTFNENTVGFQRISTKRQMPAVPFDTTEGHINHGKTPAGCLHLAWSHVLHLYVS